MFKDEILENNNRRKIYQVLEKNPGTYLRELQRIMNMPLATVEYHIDYMTRKKLIFAETEDHHKRYYTKPLDPPQTLAGHLYTNPEKPVRLLWHEEPEGKTPAEACGIKAEGKNKWLTLIQNASHHSN